ncbi:MAG: putative toxin-antitoxin system toxin component, PIN family [Desulfobacterium sp.]|nr:putative toxin-antitoxin system toxin component, PIN family [Desulfobacterium sp.]
MRIILDTNVFISGIFFSGPPSQILKAWEKQSLKIVLSQQILDEYQRVADELSTKYPLVDIMPIIELLTIYGQFVDTKDVDISICEDPDDDKFIECAIAGKCEIIVSGDAHLLRLTAYKGIKIIKPRNFIEEYL